LVITTGPAVGAPLGATDVVGLALAITVGLAVGTALAITVGLAVGAGVTGAIVGAGVTGAAVAMVGGGVGGRVGGGVGGRVGAGVTGATVGATTGAAVIAAAVGGGVGGRVGGRVGGGVLLFEITNRRQNKSSDGIRQHRRLKRHKVSIPNNSSSYCFSRQHFNSPGWSYCWRSSRFRCCWRQRNRPMG
jgi:hypothetical protein